MEVSDNGPCMNKEILARIFEPFYTSKFTGQGLGLSAVLGVIRSHGGGFRVSSEPGVRTTVTVFLPGVKETMAENSADPARVHAKKAQVRNGSNTTLSSCSRKSSRLK
nr:ATP-binding protein [uncultured Desulfobulbus sp.]